MQQCYVTVFIPAYNEQFNLPRTIAGIVEELSVLGVSFEILVVDDGSTDHTAEVAADLALRYPCIQLLRHPKNQGIGAAIKTAVSNARGDFLIFIPADLAMDISQIHRYFDAAKHADIVLGNRSDRRDYSLIRKVVSHVNIFLLRTLFGLKQHQFAYINLYKTAFLKRIRIETKGVFINNELIIKARDLGAVLDEVSIDYVPRSEGKARGASLSRVIEATWVTFAFWSLWVWRTLLKQRSKGYVD